MERCFSQSNNANAANRFIAANLIEYAILWDAVEIQYSKCIASLAVSVKAHVGDVDLMAGKNGP